MFLLNFRYWAYFCLKCTLVWCWWLSKLNLQSWLLLWVPIWIFNSFWRYIHLLPFFFNDYYFSVIQAQHQPSLKYKKPYGFHHYISANIFSLLLVPTASSLILTLITFHMHYYNFISVFFCHLGSLYFNLCYNWLPN